jgi:hypothetical protein
MASIFDGLTDFAKSALDRAPSLITAIKGPATQTTQATQTNTLPATSGAFANLPTWVKPVVIIGGGLLVVLLVWKLIKK